MKKFSSLILLLLTSLVGHSQKYHTEIIQIDNEIEGTLYSGNTESDTLIILIAGSGPTDRNGNTLGLATTNAYKWLAEGLAEVGQNIFTYDKRIIAQIKKQTVDESKGVFEDNVADLNLILTQLHQKYPKIVLMGHSEGALIGLLAARKPYITKYISLAGPGESIDKTLSKQIAQQAPFLQKTADEILNTLKSGQTVANIIPMLEPLFRSDVQPYLISWMQIDPVLEIQKINIPILIIQGDQDLQVNTLQGTNLQEANPKAQLVTIPGMNHVFKNVTSQEENMQTYKDGSIPLHKELIPTLLLFLK